MALTTVTNRLLTPQGNPATGITVVATLKASASWLSTGAAQVVTSARAVTDGTGVWTLELTPTGDYEAGDAYYEIVEYVAGGGTSAITVPSTGPVTLRSVLVTPPTPTGFVPVSELDALRDVDTTGVTDGQALTYRASDETWVPATPTGGGGAVSSVAGRTGAVALGEDDIADLGADLAGKAPTVHTHTGTDITTGTMPYGRLPVGTTTGTVTAGDDTRLTDPRAPTGAAGGDLAGTYPAPTIKTALRDPVAGTPGLRTLGTGPQQATAGDDGRLSDQRTPLPHVHPEADVTGLAGDLAGKSPTGHTHTGTDVTTGTVAYARLPVGASAGTVAAGDDERLTNARTPTAHATSHATGGSDEITPAAIGAAEHGAIYPLQGYGYHSTTCDGTTAGVQSSWGSWHTRIWVPAGNPITKVGMVITVAGAIGAGGLNAVAIYADDGQTLLGQTPDDDTFWASTGLRSLDLQAPIPAAPGGRFVRVIVNVDGYSAAPSVAYCVPADTAGGTLNGTGSLQRRSAYKGAYAGSFPTTVDPDTLGTPTNFLPFIVLG